MQFLFYKLALCWESYDKIQNSFQLLFVLTWDYSLSLKKKTTITNSQLLQTQNHRRTDCAWPLEGKGRFSFLPGVGHIQLGWF